MKARDYALLFINGDRIEARGELAAMMLSDFLRYKKGLTGTKVVCAEGDCGACTVLRKFCGAGQKTSYYEPINSCITTLGQMDGSSLITVEYLNRPGLDPVQARMVECHGSQCGYCTPGFVMALKGLTEKKCASDAKKITEKEAKNALTGNLCRCTGYRQILDAAVSIPLEKSLSLNKDSKLVGAEKSLRRETEIPFLIETEAFAFYAPIKIKDAAKYLKKNPGSRILGAGTDLGVAVNKGKLRFNTVISLHLISDLYEAKKVGNKKDGFKMRVGARVTLEKLRCALKESFPEFANYLDIFASPQIKNVATLVGNIANASPIGDTLPLLLAMNARKHVVGSQKARWIEMNDFFLGYRLVALKKDEIIEFVEFDLLSEEESLFLLKTSQRKDLDISSVNGAIRFSKDSIRVALGGVAGVPYRLRKLEALLEEKAKSPNHNQEAIDLLQKEIRPLSDLRGSQAMRRILAENFLKESLQKYQEASSC